MFQKPMIVKEVLKTVDIIDTENNRNRNEEFK